ncbi:hypothetical protein M413DRAFT_243797 [Hebeloma cylindrosporum]|uniref:Uncharacterized protein n=1 Tax=Hebeloma cylindrosporum TaxID=76867 RepID=A0A0C3C4Q1_HEBCY|nr:hypothetical protein M413DRAFT_243797 [Hebeloma cylindrosporum h7]
MRASSSGGDMVHGGRISGMRTLISYAIPFLRFGSLFTTTKPFLLRCLAFRLLVLLGFLRARVGFATPFYEFVSLALAYLPRVLGSALCVFERNPCLHFPGPYAVGFAVPSYEAALYRRHLLFKCHSRLLAPLHTSRGTSVVGSTVHFSESRSSGWLRRTFTNSSCGFATYSFHPCHYFLASLFTSRGQASL